MSALLTSLPGDIPGLLRRGSSVVWRYKDQTRRGVFHAQRVNDGIFEVCGIFDRSFAEMEALDNAPALDLTDPTGRAHAAAWVLSQRATTSSIDEAEALRLALVWSDMTPVQIDALARLVLRLAGRTP